MDSLQKQPHQLWIKMGACQRFYMCECFGSTKLLCTLLHPPFQFVMRLLKPYLRLSAFGNVATDNNQSLPLSIREKSRNLHNVEDPGGTIGTLIDLVTPADAIRLPGSFLGLQTIDEFLPLKWAEFNQLTICLALIIHPSRPNRRRVKSLASR
jgi:hypothetical protein